MLHEQALRAAVTALAKGGGRAGARAARATRVLAARLAPSAVRPPPPPVLSRHAASLTPY